MTTHDPNWPARLSEFGLPMPDDSADAADAVHLLQPPAPAPELPPLADDLARVLSRQWFDEGNTPAGDLALAADVSVETAADLVTLTECMTRTWQLAYANGNDDAARGALATIDMLHRIMQRTALWPALVANLLAGRPDLALRAEDALAEFNDAAGRNRMLRAACQR